MFHLRNKNISQLVIALIVVLSITLSGCGAKATPTPVPVAPATQAPTEAPTAVPTVAPTATPEPVNMHISWWGSQARHDITIKVIEMFMAENPNITITYDFASFGDYWTLMSTKAAGGNLSCVMQQDYAYFKQYVTDGLIIPLDPYIADGTIDLSNVSPDAIGGGKVDGKLYALSLGTNSQSFVIDTDLFQKAGVALPKPDWTWKDFEDTNMAIHDKLGIYGNGGGLENPQILNALYLSLGSGLYSDDSKALGFTDTKPLADYFSMMVRLQDAKAMLSRADQIASPPTLENNALVTGKAAMYFAHTNQIVALWKAAGESRNLQMVPVPRAIGATKSANYFKPSMFFSISSQCKTPQAAALFINYFTNSVDANKVLMAERGVPISSAVADALKPSLTKSQIASFDFLTSLLGNVSPIRPPDPAAHNDILTNVYTPLVLDPMMFHKITPEQAAQIFYTEANKILAK
jgi:multiple sugar transport system substrate-binding protein